MSIFGCALWILFDNGNLFRSLDSVELKTVATGLLLVGLVVLAVAALGYVAALCEARLMLLLYMVFLIVLVLGQLFISLVLLISREKIERALDEAVDLMIINYPDSNDLTADRLLDKLQRYEKCCGRTGPDDWKMNLYIMKNLTNKDVLPCACFNTSCPGVAGEEHPLFGDLTEGNSYQEGCKEKISDWLAGNALTILAMDASILILQVLQFILAVYLYKAIALGSRIKSSKVMVKQEPDQMEPGQNLSEDRGGFYGEENQAYLDQEQLYMERSSYTRNPDYQNRDRSSEHVLADTHHVSVNGEACDVSGPKHQREERQGFEQATHCNMCTCTHNHHQRFEKRCTGRSLTKKTID
ncbi:putative tetraspanin-19 [Merluccius polli]|uniref:Tetraspanin-19 n=1 Tax=Merluccius polli TaxID=89951 RepID=A0AA47NAS5_MERPO|nr:putative tetraspanin-19 [Merluccius polli]